MKRAFLLAVVLVMVVGMALPAAAITRGGQPDGDDHPYVGLMVAYEEVDDGQGGTVIAPRWRCSGALISPTVFVTAGHCVGPESSAEDAVVPTHASIWFDEQVVRADDAYPWYEHATDDNNAVTGVPMAFPDYVPDAFYLADLGVVVLDDAYLLDDYAELPEEGDLDRLPRGRKRASLTAVGYGLQRINPVFVEAELDRRQAELFIVDWTGVAGLGIINPGASISVSGDAKHGGTCFGDSGGPLLIGDSDVIGAVVSFGLNANCAGIGGGYRVDRADELEWIGTFLDD